MQKANIKINSELERFDMLKRKVDDVISQRKEEEEDMDDIPDEYLGAKAFPNYLCRLSEFERFVTSLSFPYFRPAHANAHEGSSSTSNFRKNNGSTNHLASLA